MTGVMLLSGMPRSSNIIPRVRNALVRRPGEASLARVLSAGIAGAPIIAKVKQALARSGASSIAAIRSGMDRSGWMSICASARSWTRRSALSICLSELGTFGPHDARRRAVRESRARGAIPVMGSRSVTSAVIFVKDFGKTNRDIFFFGNIFARAAERRGRDPARQEGG